ncbi:hypothetical protein JM84_0445 [Dokdonia sp. Hel_I_63]|uniref:hypothetical protein n=1 Tax=unclassified Dokdonia TaxID=2615033 RepID=UPI00020A730D|nr:MULTISPECIES: hypothetical protein [unclassified Dokdonia]AEE19193.1 hypothetical protein Krodi_1209 [Dokdonia sp. 4H-3-7-5]TVZ21571.1 hypothetical protein JM84_0445 [Dokdonia sp. Hel_I_63]
MDVNQQEFRILSTLPAQELQSHVDRYILFMKTTYNVRYVGFAVVGLFAIYNIFIAGKRVTYSEKHIIEMTMLTLGVLIIAILIWFLVSILKKNATLKKGLRATAEQHLLDKKSFLKEFNTLVIAQHDGKGVYKI